MLNGTFWHRPTQTPDPLVPEAVDAPPRPVTTLPLQEGGPTSPGPAGGLWRGCTGWWVADPCGSIPIPESLVHLHEKTQGKAGGKR